MHKLTSAHTDVHTNAYTRNWNVSTSINSGAVLGAYVYMLRMWHACCACRQAHWNAERSKFIWRVLVAEEAKYTGMFGESSQSDALDLCGSHVYAATDARQVSAITFLRARFAWELAAYVVLVVAYANPTTGNILHIEHSMQHLLYLFFYSLVLSSNDVVFVWVHCGWTLRAEDDWLIDLRHRIVCDLWI